LWCILDKIVWSIYTTYHLDDFLNCTRTVYCWVHLFMTFAVRLLSRTHLLYRPFSIE
jgi:hypothetical protein